VVQADVPVAGMVDTESVMIETFSYQNKLMAVMSDSNSDLYAGTYDGSSWVVTNGGAALETDLSATNSVPYGFTIRRKPIPDHMVVTATDGTAAVGGTEVLSLQLVDVYGNPLSSAFAVTVTVTGSATFTANDIGGSNGSNSLNGTLSASGTGSVTVTNTVAETVTVIADATGDEEVVAGVDGNVVFGAGAADHMLVTATDGTAAAGGTEVLSVQLVDQYGNPVSSASAVNITVSGSATFSANDIGGSNGSNALSGTLSASGSGSVTIANTVAESVTVSADAAGDAEVVANVDDGVVFVPVGADHMLVTATDGTATAGGTEVLSLQLVDEFDNPVSGALPVSVTVNGSATFSANDLGGSNGSNALSGTLSAGGTGSVTITNTVAETVTVSADATGDAQVVANVDDNVVFSGATATQLAFSVQPSDTQATIAISPAIRVQVEDTYGNPATGTQSITLAIGSNPTGGILSGTLTVAAIGGEATFSDISVSRAGNGYTLTASATGLTGATSTAFNVAAGPPTQIVFTTQPGAALAGRTISGPPTVELRDLNGDPVTADNSTQVTLAIKSGTGTAGAALSGTVTKTAVNGVVTFDDLAINLAGSGYVLTASASGLTDVDSSTFNVDAVLNLSSTDSSDPVQSGQTISYILTYSNSSATETALSVTLTDVVPANTNFLSASDGGSESAGVVSWSLGDLGPGVSGARTFVVQVDSPLANGTLLVDSAAAQSTQGDIALAAQTTTVQSAPVLTTSVSDNPDPVQSGLQITYTLTFSNSSIANETALAATLTDTLSADTTFVSASDGGTEVGGVVTWSLGDLAPGANGTRTLTVQVNTPLANGALLTTDAMLQDSQGNTATASQTTTVQSASILSVAVSDNPDPVESGSQITYTISYGNSGAANETPLGVTLTDTLPSNTTFVSASDGGTVDGSGTLVTWSLGDLVPGASGTRTLVIRVNSQLADGTILTNNIMLQHPQGSGATANESTTVNSPVLSLSMSDSPDPVEAGEQITYTLSFSNASDANEAALGVTLTDTLPSNATFVSASDGGTEAGGVVTWSLGDLSPGQGGTRTLVVQADSQLAVGTLITNSGRAEDNQGHNATANQTTTLQSIALLSLSQSNDHDPILPGDQVIITLTFSNSNGANEIASGVTLTNTLPANTTFLSASDGGTVDGTGSIVSWSLWGTVHQQRCVGRHSRIQCQF